MSVCKNSILENLGVNFEEKNKSDVIVKSSSESCGKVEVAAECLLIRKGGQRFTAE